MIVDYLWPLAFLINCTPLSALNRIVGGKKVSSGEFPYQLSLRLDGSPICGAVLISAATGLTAAHCMQDHGSYSVLAGTVHKRKGGVVAYVRQALLHPGYDSDNDDCDLAILKLLTPLRLSVSIRPIKLPKQDEDLPGRGYVSGWGSVSPILPMYSAVLRVVELPVLSMRTCVNSYKYVKLTPKMFCAGYREGGRDSCQGDSGGPFVSNGTLYGLVSWGFNCAEPGYPGVYTRIPSFVNYIKANAGIE